MLALFAGCGDDGGRGPGGGTSASTGAPSSATAQTGTTGSAVTGGSGDGGDPAGSGGRGGGAALGNTGPGAGGGVDCQDGAAICDAFIDHAAACGTVLTSEECASSIAVLRCAFRDDVECDYLACIATETNCATECFNAIVAPEPTEGGAAFMGACLDAFHARCDGDGDDDVCGQAARTYADDILQGLLPCLDGESCEEITQCFGDTLGALCAG